MTELTAAAQRALTLMDLTTLNDDDTDEKVIALCRQANSPAGHTAAICIYPRFIPVARKALREQDPDARHRSDNAGDEQQLSQQADTLPGKVRGDLQYAREDHHRAEAVLGRDWLGRDGTR